MNGRIAILCAAVLVILPSAFAQIQEDKVQVVNTARITDINAKKRTLKVKSDVADTPPPTQGGGGGDRRGGGVGLPGGGFPGGGGGRRGGGYPGGGNRPSQPEGREFKVTLAKEAILKEGDSDIPFSSLKVGDHIVITGNPKGNDVEATSITRDKH
jgi:hypothetical protein